MTRDSLLWWLVIIAAVGAYLATMPAPTEWTWAQWCQTIAALAATIAGKLSTSPLPGSSDAPKDARITPGTVAKYGAILMLAGSLGWSACASARHIAVAADVTIAQTVFAIDDAERAACQQHVLTTEQCAKFDPVILKSLEDVKAVTASLQATPKLVAVPTTLPDLIADLATLQHMAAPLASTGGLGMKINAALAKAAAILNSFAGGQ
jgi:hypothetical protein